MTQPITDKVAYLDTKKQRLLKEVAILAVSKQKPCSGDKQLLVAKGELQSDVRGFCRLSPKNNPTAILKHALPG